MSLSTQTLKRLPTIKEGLLQGLSREEIGKRCGRTEKTIDRDITAWVQSGTFETWLKEEFIRLHPLILKAYPETAYREIARLVGKMLTRKIEAHSIEEIRETKIILSAKLIKNDSTNSNDKLRTPPQTN